MDAIRLVPATRDDLDVVRDADTSMVHEWRVAPGYNEFREAMDVFVGMLDAGIAPEWATHLLVHEADATLIGLVGYKGPPVDGTVEIGYQVAPAYPDRTPRRRCWTGPASTRQATSRTPTEARSGAGNVT